MVISLPQQIKDMMFAGHCAGTVSTNFPLRLRMSEKNTLNGIYSVCFIGDIIAAWIMALSPGFYVLFVVCCRF